LDSSEKRLYSQIHPAKLATDISMSILTLYLFWVHDLVPAVILHIGPSILVSYLIIRFANLERYMRSGLGQYLAKYMTNRMQLVRLLGDLITVVGAWFQTFWVIGVGLAVVALGWARGLIVRRA